MEIINIHFNLTSYIILNFENIDSKMISFPSIQNS